MWLIVCTNLETVRDISLLRQFCRSITSQWLKTYLYMSAKSPLPFIFGQNWPTQQSHGLFTTAKLLERKFQGAKVPSSKIPGSELTRVLLELSLQRTNWPRSEKGSVYQLTAIQDSGVAENLSSKLWAPLVSVWPLYICTGPIFRYHMGPFPLREPSPPVGVWRWSATALAMVKV